MKTFTPGKAIRRLVPIKSCVKGWADQPFVVEITAAGVTTWRKGRRKDAAHYLSWRFLIGQGFLFGEARKPRTEHSGASRINAKEAM